MYRLNGASIEVLLVHPGGPFWAKKDEASWSIPKGEYGSDEDPLSAARREFNEETGFAADGDFLPLGDIKLKSGKIVSAWAVEGSIDASAIKSNLFSMEWPPKSGRQMEFPEVDRAAWFAPAEAQKKLNPSQAPLIQRLVDRVTTTVSPSPRTS